MRFYLPLLLSLSVALPAFGEPPPPVAQSPAVTEVPLATEGDGKSGPVRDNMPPTRVAGITVTSIGAALASVGIGFAVAAAEYGSASDGSSTSLCDQVLDDMCFVGGTYADLEDTADTYSTVAAVSVSVGLVAMTTGVILIGLPGPEVEPSAASVQLDIGPARLGLRGRF